MPIKIAAIVVIWTLLQFASYAIGYEIGRNSPCAEQESFEIHPVE